MHDPDDGLGSDETSGTLPERPATTVPDLVIPPEMLTAGEKENYELNVIGALPERPVVTEGERTVLGALERFRTITEGAMREFRVSMRNRTSEPWAAAVKLRNACEEAGLELRRTLELHDTLPE